jgi:hypothetical protein
MFRVLHKAFYRLPCAFDPCAGGLGSMLANVLATRAEIILASGVMTTPYFILALRPHVRGHQTPHRRSAPCLC